MYYARLFLFKEVLHLNFNFTWLLHECVAELDPDLVFSFFKFDIFFKVSKSMNLNIISKNRIMSKLNLSLCLPL